MPADKSFSFKTEIQPNGDRKILLAGHLGLQMVEVFEKSIQASSTHTSLDLRDIDFLDSAGALALLELADRIKARGGSCSLDNVPAKAQGILGLIDIEALKQKPLLGAGRKIDLISRIGDEFLILIQDLNERRLLSGRSHN